MKDINYLLLEPWTKQLMSHHSLFFLHKYDKKQATQLLAVGDKDVIQYIPTHTYIYSKLNLASRLILGLFKSVKHRRLWFN